ncbi:hypothetical protein KQY27_00200 [Methanobrevibacter sp. TMH8]|uniref:hypothetical protein n=1 Tax=Methanobrevibacter sp. TMH8 TaxID=2848611 RepID=UPI001CCC126B|nr:hypothetical protein [Methanobrevibacter sp. TMH8]MBZ9569979.1 hypothetical protein [Methanobrevibacter sp. TMH8]
MVDYTEIIKDNKTYLSHLHTVLNQEKKNEIKLSPNEKVTIIKEARAIQKDIIKYERYNK